MHQANPVDVHGYALANHEIGCWQRAMLAARNGALVDAAELMLGIATREPAFTPAKVQASYFLLAADHYRRAREIALEAAAEQPHTAGLAVEVIRLLRRFEEHQAILRVHDGVDWKLVRPVSLLVALAAELGPIGLYSQARDLLDAARDEAQTVQALVVGGTLATISGDTTRARTELHRALDVSTSELAHVRWMLSMQPDEALIPDALAQVRAGLRRVAPHSEDAAYLFFALHNLHHAAGEYGAAWDALAQGCAVKRRLLRYDASEHHRMFELLSSHDWHARVRESADAGEGLPGLIFIVGMHRSGTSVLERVLAGHRGVRDGGESYVFPACMREATDHLSRGVMDLVMATRLAGVSAQTVAERFVSYARWRAAGLPWFIEKLPSNFLHIGAILAAFPDARILHMVRDPMDTCFSNLRTFFSDAAPYSYDQQELADFYGLYHGLMRHWHRLFPGRILDIDYQEFVADPESQTRTITGYCGLPYEPGALDTAAHGGHAATASLATVRRGILKDRGGAWKPYEDHLRALGAGLRRIAAAG